MKFVSPRRFSPYGLPHPYIFSTANTPLVFRAVSAVSKQAGNHKVRAKMIRVTDAGCHMLEE
jgi:hypothetical protein